MSILSNANPEFADISARALAAVDHIPAMVAYWDSDLVCQFANGAYLEWFGKTREDLLGTTLPKLLGPLYAVNRPYIERALAGTVQLFERRIPVPGTSKFRDSIATYIPDIEGGLVRGLVVHVADVTLIKQREKELLRVIGERDQALEDIRGFRRAIDVCANCKSVRDEGGRWVPVDSYVNAGTNARVSRALCPTCLSELLPELR